MVRQRINDGLSDRPAPEGRSEARSLVFWMAMLELFDGTPDALDDVQRAVEFWTAQSPTAIVLRREGGKETVVPRASIRKMYAANLSAMPADLEQQVDVQQMADLIKYITTSR